MFTYNVDPKWRSLWFRFVHLKVFPTFVLWDAKSKMKWIKLEQTRRRRRRDRIEEEVLIEIFFPRTFKAK